jgi:death on curing protein
LRCILVRSRKEPHWLSRVAVDAIHSDQIREHGGLAGIRDENSLESALGRPRNKFFYAPDSDIATLAAAYGFGLITNNHPYRDGNKRIAFLAIATFLGINGYELSATDADVVTAMFALAAGTLTEAELRAWIRKRILKLPSSVR